MNEKEESGKYTHTYMNRHGRMKTRWTDEWIWKDEGRTDGWVGEWMDGWLMDECVHE